ncbi:MAG: VOC family protein [Caulobacterales bacterium]|nr:VOC family protein [Caulobacterales bacterium]
MSAPALGTLGWLDLTVDDAASLRDFYADVMGWTPQAVSMGEGAYEDYAMAAPGGDAVAGVCWRKGGNAKLPPVWIPYVVVDDIDARVERALARGASIIDDRRGPEGMSFVVIKDPAGAVIALFAG